jgi:hypothetical protein
VLLLVCILCVHILCISCTKSSISVKNVIPIQRLSIPPRAPSILLTVYLAVSRYTSRPELYNVNSMKIDSQENLVITTSEGKYDLVYHYFNVLHCTALHCTALHCTALQCNALQCTAQQTQHCTAPHCFAPSPAVLHYTTLHYTKINLWPLKCNILLFLVILFYF